MTKDLQVCERVKLTGHAFKTGVYPDTAKFHEMRGVVAHQSRDPWVVPVRWYGRKSVERLWHGFVRRAK